GVSPRLGSGCVRDDSDARSGRCGRLALPCARVHVSRDHVNGRRSEHTAGTRHRTRLRTSGAAMNNILDSALALAALDVPTFPVKENKRPCWDGGFKAATTDP